MQPGQIARFRRGADGRLFYLVRATAREGGASLTLRFDDLEAIREIFSERAALGRTGETFLADARGFFLTPPAFVSRELLSHPIDALPMRRCLAGQDGALLARDYAGRAVIHGFRYVRGIGGGCIMAHTLEAEAFAPARALRTQIVGFGAGLALVSLVVSVLLARRASRPIYRLADAARALERGAGEVRVPEQGPAEIQELAVAFNSMQRSILEHTRELETANRAKADFLAAMSHELRTPLNAIGGYTELLEIGVYGPVTEAQREALHRIRRSQSHLLGLINGVLNFAKLEAGQIQFNVQPVLLEPALEEVGSLLEPQVRAKGLRYQLGGCTSDVWVHADREKLQQVVLNLVSNAVKFTEPGGLVSLECAVEADVVAVHVRDTGPGIPPDKLNTVFEPFVQVDRQLTTPVEGTGLGLAISRDLAVAMEGNLTATSRLGEGSTFTLTLRRSPPAPSQRQGGRPG